MTTPTIHIEQTWDELQKLASFSEVESPAVTRILFTEQDLAGRAYLVSLFEAAGLVVRTDAVGNIFARWVGADSEAGAVGTGSHTDAIPHSGRFDGTIGVVGALEAIRALQRSGFRPARSIELLMFTSEEPTRFGLGCLGSRLLSLALSADRASKLLDSEGQTLETVRRAAGCSGDLTSVALPKDYYAGFVELHIEQGPQLEQAGLDIGIVTAIAAPATLRMQLTGAGGHAGATLMPGRRDALLAAAEIALAVEDAALSSGSVNAVATTGLCKIHPNAVNSIPSQATLEIDIRDTSLAVRDAMVNKVQESARHIAGKRKVEIKQELLNADPPATCDAKIVEAIHRTVEEQGLSYQKMVSRAYHDSLFMARIAPTAMIFIPCRGGISHRPDEYVTAEQLQKGVAVLAGTLAKLAG